MRISFAMCVRVGAVLFCAVSMAVMLFFAKNKAIVIEGLPQDQVEGAAGAAVGYETETGQLRFTEREERGDCICIPLEDGVPAENVTIENHYMDKQIWISIRGASADYYKEAALSGELSCITDGIYEVRGEDVVLKLSARAVYECRSTLEERKLYIEMLNPWEVYDKIIVIDASCGGRETGIVENGLTEKDVTLDIVKQLKILLDSTDIKVYYTRMEDVDVPDEDRAALANEVRADMFISVRLNASEDKEKYGTEVLYNAGYYLPDFNGVSLADSLERAVVTRVSGRGNGLYEAADSDVLVQNAKVPVAVLEAGYVSNEQEAALLSRADYRGLIAAGIADAVTKVYEEGSVITEK